MILSFRLLMELYSFLCNIASEINGYIGGWLGFRLLMELYSFLFPFSHSHQKIIYISFPSPYGVIFILIAGTRIEIKGNGDISFRLLMEYHSFLL